MWELVRAVITSAPRRSGLVVTGISSSQGANREPSGIHEQPLSRADHGADPLITRIRTGD